MSRPAISVMLLLCRLRVTSRESEETALMSTRLLELRDSWGGREGKERGEGGGGEGKGEGEREGGGREEGGKMIGEGNGRERGRERDSWGG